MPHLHNFLLPAILALALARSSAAAPPPPKAADIARLVGQLGSERFEQREAASRALERIGEPALQALREAARSKDAEVRRRAAGLVSRIEGRDPVKWEKARLRGSWVVVKAELSGQQLPLETKQGPLTIRWRFAQEKVTIRGLSDLAEDSTYRIDPTMTPKHLDLTPIRGEDRTTTKCLYSLKGDELKVACTAVFVPMKPEEEKRQARESKQTRPKQIDPEGDTVLVFTLKRDR